MKIYNTEGRLIPDVHDALYELCNAGTGMVSITIGQLLNTRITISTPEVMTEEPDTLKFADILQDEEVAFFVMHMRETMTGDVAFVLGKELIVDAVGKMTGINYSFEEMIQDEEGLSAVQEFGNIIGSAYVKAIGEYTGMRFFLSPVLVGLERASKVMTAIYEHTSDQIAHKIHVESTFSMRTEQGEKIGQNGHIIMMPEDNSVEKLMDAIDM